MDYGKINEDGCLSIREASEELANKLFKDGWKRIETPACELICGENERIKAIPADAGGHITFTYEKVINKEGIQRKIDNLIKEVAATDYQARKCYEYSLVGKPLPYDIQKIHTESEEIREKIRALEVLIGERT